MSFCPREDEKKFLKNCKLQMRNRTGMCPLLSNSCPLFRNNKPAISLLSILLRCGSFDPFLNLVNDGYFIAKFIFLVNV